MYMRWQVLLCLDINVLIFFFVPLLFNSALFFLFAWFPFMILSITLSFLCLPYFSLSNSRKNLSQIYISFSVLFPFPTIFPFIQFRWFSIHIGLLLHSIFYFLLRILRYLVLIGYNVFVIQILFLKVLSESKLNSIEGMGFPCFAPLFVLNSSIVPPLNRTFSFIFYKII